MIIKCGECGKEFEPNVSTQKYCSRQCKCDFNNRKNREKSKSMNKYPNGFGHINCIECGNRFEKTSAISKYCSPSCRNKYHRELHKVKKDNIYMEDVEDFVYDLIETGTKARNKNISSEYRFGMINTSLRDKISTRDGYTCRICGADTNLEIHHIIKVIHGGDNNQNNLITLCKSCHRAVDTLDYNHAIKKCKINFVNNFNNKRITNKNVNSILDDCYKEVSRIYNLFIDGSLDNLELVKSLNYILETIENNKAD